ncbi:MAG: PLP-dependent aminotransferase family protein [Pirellulales bacterium]|nr:PLP-dependent aminotransferase family protein [Pirellulales bacterium]
MSAPIKLSQRAQRTGPQPIAELINKALADPELISLAAGFVDQRTLPVTPTSQAFDLLLKDTAHTQAALQYGSTPGHPPLRQAVLDRWRDADGDPECQRAITARQVLITAGSNQLLYVLADTLCDPGDIVLCAAPTYFVFMGVLRGAGARAYGVETDADGMVPEALEESLREIDRAGELSRVKAIYVVSYFDNPGTKTLAAARRPQLVEIARRWSRHHRIYVIDDAAYRDLRYQGDDIPSLLAYDDACDTVILTHTFSKCFAPGVRTGYGILPVELVGPVNAQKGNLDFGAPNLVQFLLLNVLQQGLLEPHLAELRTAYQVKLDAMLDALDEHLGDVSDARWSRPTGGLYTWLELPEGLDTGPDGPLFERALAEKVLYVPGEHCFPSEGCGTRRNGIRLTFGVQPPVRIREGIAALARAVRGAMAVV